MIETKCIRKFDELGRIVIPLEIRRKVFGETVDNGEQLMEIFCEKDGTIILKPYQKELDEAEKRVEDVLKYVEEVQKHVEQTKKDVADVKEQKEELAKELEKFNECIDALVKEVRRNTIAEKIRKERES